MVFHNPWGLIGLLAIPVIIFMYLLKQKYNEVEVPAIFLWEKAYTNSMAQRPWQKLKKNLLLFLQLLITVLLVLAISDPSFLREQEHSHYILVLDQSMSMQAQDIKPTRFAYAKDQMKKLVNGANDGATFTIVILGNDPFIAVNQMEDKSTINRRLDEIAVSNRSVDWSSAQSIVSALYEQYSGQVILFSDRPGKFEDIPVTLNLIQGKGNQGNIAIKLLTHGIEEAGIIALVRVNNYGNTSSQSSVILYGDDEIIDIKEVRLKPREERQIFFTNINRDTKVLKAHLEESDVLPIDNQAYDVIEKEAVTKVLLVSEQNGFLERIFNLLPQVELYKTTIEDWEGAEGYNLYVFDGGLPEILPEDGHMLIINPPKSHPPILTVGEMVQVGRMYPLESQLLDQIPQIDFAIQKARFLEKPEWAKEILTTEETPLILVGERESQKIGVIGFDLHHTDLPLKKEFPILMHNLFTWFIPEQGRSMSGLHAGDDVKLSIQPAAQEVQMILPDGTIFPLAPPFPVAPFTETEQTGIYLLEQKIKGENKYQLFAINPPVEEESDIGVELVNSTENETQVEQEVLLSQGRWHVGRIIILFVLCGLLLEWWVFSRAH